MKIIVAIIPADLVKNSILPYFSFRRNQKQGSNFEQAADLVTRNISVFCL